MLTSNSFRWVMYCCLAFFLFGFQNLAIGSGGIGIPQTVTPNAFEGTDTERIIHAIEAAKESVQVVRIPKENANGTSIWMIDSALLLPSNMTLILDNCTLQLSDTSRDNLFRSDNVGAGITDPVWNENIRIYGIGNAVLKGAVNPRATGDGARTLSLNPQAEQEKGNWRVSYGSDAGKPGLKQTGDWRNIMVLIGYVRDFSLKNVRFENAHGWTISFERTVGIDLSDVTIFNEEFVTVDGEQLMTANKDGINLRQGCKNVRIDHVSGVTGDDFIALSNLDTAPDIPKQNGDINGSMVTASRWYGPEDDIEQVVITNISCENRYRAVAIRGSDRAGIHHIYISGVIFRAMEDRYEALLIGGRGYGEESLPGKIHTIQAMNIMGNGQSLVRIQAKVANCHFLNGMYTGVNERATLYEVDPRETSNVTESTWLKVR
ncbi:glycoside hydrolase family protein [Cyclobacterium salsum]|uniref:glycosyl hydrolase family 28 protein n=1 Tax=Cyclobacterium salsum TaxID=2666329 RepID=UPI001F165CDC|nr:glycosyl hydrolase family 28 protein [Cyclobacterium salsum]